MKAIPYGHQHITDEDIQAVIETLKSDYLTQGPKIIEFEQAFARYVGAKYAVAVSNATAGLHLAATALQVRSGDKVIVTPITFAASANCIRYCNGMVVFCDIDPDTYFIDSNGEKQFCGNGKFADVTVFSFHPVKHIATGEGGMVTTNDKELFDRLSLLRTHGITKNPACLHENHGGWYYEMQELGYNYRLTDFQAALGLSQLKRADEGLKRRQKIAVRYNEAFKRIADIQTPYASPDVFHAYHLYIIQVPDRLDLYNYLHENGIYAQVHYIPLHLMPYYREQGNKPGDLPVAEKYYSRCLSLPMFPTLTDEEQEYVIKKIEYYFNK